MVLFLLLRFIIREKCRCGFHKLKGRDVGEDGWSLEFGLKGKAKYILRVARWVEILSRSKCCGVLN